MEADLINLHQKFDRWEEVEDVDYEVKISRFLLNDLLATQRLVRTVRP